MVENSKKPIIGIFAFPLDPEKYNVPYFNDDDEYFQKYCSKEFMEEYKKYLENFPQKKIVHNQYAKQGMLIHALESSGAEVRMIFPTRPDVCCINTRMRDYANDPLEDEEIRLLGKQMEGVSALLGPGGNKHYPGEYYMVESIVKMGIPYLGICAGCQILASINKRGEDGIFYNDIVKLKELDKTGEVYNNHSRLENMGKVEIMKGTPLYDILEADSVNVRWMHGLVSNYTDNTILPAAFTRENVHLNDADLKENIMYMGCYVNGSEFQIGVQWHPEAYYEDEVNKRLFDKFVAFAGKRKPLSNEDTAKLINLMKKQQNNPEKRTTRLVSTRERLIKDLRSIRDIAIAKGFENVQDVVDRREQRNK